MLSFFRQKSNYRPNAAVIVTDGKGKILLCQRENDKKYFQSVQGGVDAGETAEQAARREIKEEIGLDPDQYEFKASLLGKQTYDWPLEVQNGRKDDFVGQEQSFFLAEVDPGVEFDLDYHHREFSNVRWGTPEELLKKAWPPKRPLLEKALKGFGLLD